jgi:hypothetical protein
LVGFGAGTLAPIVLGPDQVQAGRWYRVKATLRGDSAEVLITEAQEANPRRFSAKLERRQNGRIGLADLTQAVGYANVFVRELK